ncbi:MAG TPA: lyase [Chloroflexota bacterium]|jgi:virginiamycin B lyase|nr:lyase [Chloroflexota bacterium]
MSRLLLLLGQSLIGAAALGWSVWLHPATAWAQPDTIEFPVERGAGPHDVAPAADGTVWYTGQGNGTLGRLYPESGEVRSVSLGSGAAPHGVIVGPDGAAWVTDGGRNAILRVDPDTEQIISWPVHGRSSNLNTATFDRYGQLWFTGQNGVYGRLDPASGQMDVWDAPRGPGAYGIDSTPSGEVYFASLASSYLGHVNLETGQAEVLDPPTPGQGARRVWSDSSGRLWISEWDAGQLGMYDPATGSWREWRLPGASPRPYAVYVDDDDDVWLSDWGSNSLVRFTPATESWQAFPIPTANGLVRQVLGRPGEIWAAESAQGKLLMIRTRQ